MNDTTALLPHIRLHFNIEHPSFEECYAYGYECALAEVGEEENPYREGTTEHNYWQEGWWAGFYGEKPLFEFSKQLETYEVMQEKEAANDQSYHLISSLVSSSFLANVLKITGALAATAVVGYQVFELVA